ncbi:type II toxin-antitoxin system antitoxin SocA domain-containing protein [Psychrobacter sp. S1-30-MNA-CIBAN-0213]|uniref:Panacea domain-containing protein n=1 Tax=unclassified Psychrobacter TaxID=196806 RepID=UPI003329E091
MTTSAKVIANAFIERSHQESKPLSNMQLQKLVYIANGFCLALLDKPLYYDETFAWTYGPLIKPLYSSLMNYGSKEVTLLININDYEDGIDENEMKVINYVWSKYSDMTAYKLSDLTHQVGTPWDITWKNNDYGVIDNDLIAAYYKDLIESIIE